MSIIDDVIKPDDKQVPDDSNKNFLEEFVGEGKKYKTPEELAKAKDHADKHIDKLIAEKRELEAKYIAMSEHQKTISEIVAELQTQKPIQNVQTPAVTQAIQSIQTPDIAAIVSAQLAEREAKERFEHNKIVVRTNLEKEFGSLDSARQALQQYIGGNEDKKQAIDKLLVVDFENAIKLVKATSGTQTSFNDSSSTKKVTMPSGSAGLTWSKCEEIRKKDPKMYRSLEFQKMIHASAASNPNFLKS